MCVCVFVAVWQVCATPRLSSAGGKGRGGDAVLSPTITVETGTFSVKGTMRSTRLVPGISVSLYRRSSTRCFVLATWKGGSCLPCRTHLFISFSSLFFFSFLFTFFSVVHSTRASYVKTQARLSVTRTRIYTYGKKKRGTSASTSSSHKTAPNGNIEGGVRG